MPSSQDVDSASPGTLPERSWGALLRALAEVECVSPDGCLVLYAVRDESRALLDFECVFSNAAMARLPRGRGGLLPGQCLLKRYSSARAQSYFAVLRQVVETRQPCLMEVSPPGVKDHWLRVCLTPFEDGVLVRCQDVTSSKRLEQERDALLTRLEKLSMSGQLATGVGHEINNPLAFVAGNLHVALEHLAGLKDEGASPLVERLREPVQALEEARQGAERIRSIVQDLRTLARADGAALEPVDVHAALEFSVSLAMSQLRYRARVERQYGELPPVRANEAKLGQVFLNLLINAAQAIPETDGVEHRVSLVTRREGDRVVVEVRDTGLGMAPEVLSRIFEPYFTTKAPGEGLGLGLPICLGIMRSMSGGLAAESTVGQGSTFRVTLPVYEGEARLVAASAPVPARRDAPVRKRVLIIDDEPGIGSVLRRLLGRVHEVVVLSRGLDALELLEKDDGFDRIFCDLMMADLTGMQLHARLSRSRPEVLSRFVYMTGGGFTESAREFLRRVTEPRIDKPFDTDAIRALVADAPPRSE
ncbi:MAG: ATP-binding protein [Cystobacter sp.]